MIAHPLTARSATVALIVSGVGLSVVACGEDAVTNPRAQLEASADFVNGPATKISYSAKSELEYYEKWANIYGPLELAAGGSLAVSRNGEVNVRAVPFHVGADLSVFDHLKYIAVSTEAFSVPAEGSLTFSARIEASTPGTTSGRVVQGCYGAPFSYLSVGDPCAAPWSAVALEGMQAGVVLNMINFATGQLFDWFVSGNTVFALIERLPSNVTGNATDPSDPNWVGLNKAYTQIIKEAPITPGKKYDVSIRYTRGPGVSMVEYFLNGALFASVDDVGVPLDVQGVPFTGIASSYGPGEVLNAQLDSFVIGHGLFSLLDQFPYQHPDRPELSVSIPMSERLFGQGADGVWSDFLVTIQPR